MHCHANPCMDRSRLLDLLPEAAGLDAELERYLNNLLSSSLVRRPKFGPCPPSVHATPACASG